MEETKTLKDVTVNVKQGASSFYLKEGTEPIKVIRHKAITADGRLIPEEIDETNINCRFRYDSTNVLCDKGNRQGTRPSTPSQKTLCPTEVGFQSN